MQMSRSTLYESDDIGGPQTREPNRFVAESILEKITDERDIVDYRRLRQITILAQVSFVALHATLGRGASGRQVLLLWDHPLTPQKRHQMVERGRVARNSLPITMAAPQILRGMFRADAAQSNPPVLEPAAEASSEHQLSSHIATVVSLLAQGLREQAQMRRDRTDWPFLRHTEQNHVVVDAVSHDRLLSPKNRGGKEPRLYRVDLPRLP
jgi:hypothetical protein